MDISEKLRYLRREKGLTQAELAQIAGVSAKAVSAWELGTRDPKIGPIKNICIHFGIDLNAFIDQSANLPESKPDLPELKETFAQNLQRLMKKSDVNTADLARALSLSFTTVSDWVHGRKYPRMDKVQALADFFGVMKSDLTESKPDLPKGAFPIDFSHYHPIPILGRISAGLPIYAEENIEGYTLTDLNHGGEYFALRVRGDSMNAAQIVDGGLVIVRRQEEVEDSEIAVVLVDNDSTTVKRFYRTGTTVTLIPQSTNPEHKPQIYDLAQTSIQILGKVIKAEVLVE